MMAVTVRELPAAEFHRLTTVAPFDTAGAPDPATAQVIVIEDGDQIVGYWGLYRAVHAEPLWVDEKYRTPKALQNLIDTLIATLQDAQVPVVFAQIDPSAEDLIRPMAAKFGFHEIPGRLVFFVVPEKGT